MLLVFLATDQYSNSYSGIENILGGGGNDVLNGNAADNLLDGGAGDDVLLATAGDVTLAGGTGEDTFTVTAEAGLVQISDFGFNSDADQIDVSALTSFFRDPQALMDALSFSDGETTFDVDLSEGTRQVLIQSEEKLEEADFLF